MKTRQPESAKPSLPTTALSKACEHCGELFWGMPSQLAKRRFCSQDCVGASRRGIKRKEWVTIRCQQCGTEFEVTPGWTRNGRRKYCSKKCLGLATVAGRRTGIRHTDESRQKMADALTGRYTGRNSHAWKGGRWLSRAGYAHVMISELPEDQQAIARAMAPKDHKYVMEHRLVMAMKLGRPLTKSEVVHHHNGVKDDNRSDNLFLRDQSSHSLEHRMIDRELARLQERVIELEAENERLRFRST